MGGEGKVDQLISDDRNEKRGTIFEKSGGNRIEFTLFVLERI